MKRIPLYSNGLRVIGHVQVDDADFERLMLWRWSINADGYAQRSYKTADGTTRSVTMHRQILGLQLGEQFLGDHANRDRLDNRRENLRIATAAQNAQHRGVSRRARSRFRGVNYVASTGRWIARVRIGSKLHNLGTYATEEEAARVAALFRAEHMPFSIEEAAA